MAVAPTIKIDVDLTSVREVREELQQILDSVRVMREHLELRDRMNASIHCGPVRWSPITDKANDAERRLAVLLNAATKKNTKPEGA